MIEVLRAADKFFDAAPRVDAVVEQLGPFTLFRSLTPFPYYARPRLELDAAISSHDLSELAARCKQLGIKLAIEWIGELTPSLEPAALAYGLEVERHVLLSLAPGGLRSAAPPDGVAIELLGARDERLNSARAVADVAFTAGGTDVGQAGVDDREARAAALPAPVRAVVRRRTADGIMITAAATDPRDGVVAVGALRPVGHDAEIVAVATLPTHRRRGLAAAVTSELVREAERRGISFVLLSAQSEAVARVYERVGFERIGTHLEAELPSAL